MSLEGEGVIRCWWAKFLIQPSLPALSNQDKQREFQILKRTQR
jgi:hypothetical protein